MRRLSRRSRVAAKSDLPLTQLLRCHAARVIEVNAYSRIQSASLFEIPAGPTPASLSDMHGIEKRIVYILRSDVDPSRHYIGIANDLRARLEWHKQGPCGHTVSHHPWSVVVSLEFPDEPSAVRFEKYLKSGSGRAFANRHFRSG